MNVTRFVTALSLSFATAPAIASPACDQMKAPTRDADCYKYATRCDLDLMDEAQAKGRPLSGSEFQSISREIFARCKAVAAEAEKRRPPTTISAGARDCVVSKEEGNDRITYRMRFMLNRGRAGCDKTVHVTICSCSSRSNCSTESVTLSSSNLSHLDKSQARYATIVEASFERQPISTRRCN